MDTPVRVCPREMTSCQRRSFQRLGLCATPQLRLRVLGCEVCSTRQGKTPRTPRMPTAGQYSSESVNKERVLPLSFTRIRNASLTRDALPQLPPCNPEP